MLPLVVVLLFGCTYAHVPPGCSMERTYTVACEKKNKNEPEAKKDDAADAIVVPMP